MYIERAGEERRTDAFPDAEIHAPVVVPNHPSEEKMNALGSRIRQRIREMFYKTSFVRDFQNPFPQFVDSLVKFFVGNVGCDDFLHAAVILVNIPESE